MRFLAFLALAAAAGCGKAPESKQADTPGAKLEAAARSAGLVSDAAVAGLTGSYARDTDRVCIVPGAGGGSRIGAVVDFGDGQGCTASGSASRSADGLDIDFGGCRFIAGVDDGHIVFPAELPAACDSLCTGRASFSALDVARLSDSASEAATLRSPTGAPLCG